MPGVSLESIERCFSIRCRSRILPMLRFRRISMQNEFPRRLRLPIRPKGARLNFPQEAYRKVNQRLGVWMPRFAPVHFPNGILRHRLSFPCVWCFGLLQGRFLTSGISVLLFAVLRLETACIV